MNMRKIIDQPNEFKVRLSIDEKLGRILLKNGGFALLVALFVSLIIPTKTTVLYIITFTLLPLGTWLGLVIVAFVVPFVALVGNDVYRKYSKIYSQKSYANSLEMLGDITAKYIFRTTIGLLKSDRNGISVDEINYVKENMQRWGYNHNYIESEMKRWCSMSPNEIKDSFKDMEKEFIKPIEKIAKKKLKKSDDINRKEIKELPLKERLKDLMNSTLEKFGETEERIAFKNDIENIIGS